MTLTSIPKEIGRYRIERLLGQGAMGSVYLGRDPELERPVAIKTVRNLELISDQRRETFIERFRNEAKAAARLSHPAIVGVFDVGEDDEAGPYLVFEYVAGSTLKQILADNGAFAPEQAVLLARQLASALDTAHDARVIHRDIKPDNILVSPSGDVKLADFGVARVPDAALTREGQFLGTPCYAAPETLDKGRYGRETDLFSFAAVVYELLSGERAFPGTDAIAVAHAVVHDTPLPPAEVAKGQKVPESVDALVMQGLSKDPNERFETAMAFVDAITAAYLEKGVFDRDPTGALILPSTSSRAESRQAAGQQRWAFPLALAIIGIVGVYFVVQFRDGANDPLTMGDVDAGVAIDAALIEDAGVDAGSPDAGPPDAGVLDAGPPDSGLSEVDRMSAFERDEAAKDAISDARRALRDGDLAAAREHLVQAGRFDSGNEDIPQIRAEIEALEAAHPTD